MQIGEKTGLKYEEYVSSNGKKERRPEARVWAIRPLPFTAIGYMILRAGL